jgi:hypothetical protein
MPSVTFWAIRRADGQYLSGAARLCHALPAEPSRFRPRLFATEAQAKWSLHKWLTCHAAGTDCNQRIWTIVPAVINLP